MCMRGGTVDGMTEDEIEMDRTERKRMGKLSKQARQRQQAGIAKLAKKGRGKRGRGSRLGGDEGCVLPGPRCAIPGGRAPRPCPLGLFQVVKA